MVVRLSQYVSMLEPNVLQFVEIVRDSNAVHCTNIKEPSTLLSARTVFNFVHVESR